jgi:hypothetical protein
MYTILKIGKKPYFYTYTVGLEHYIRMMNFELKRGSYATHGIQSQYDGTPMKYKVVGTVYTKQEAMAAQLEKVDKDKHCLNYARNLKGEHGVQKPGKLTPSKIRKIRDFCHSGLPMRTIGKMFDISHVTVVRVKTGESYSYID